MAGIVVSAQQPGGLEQIGDLLALAIGLLIVIIILAYSIRVVREYERVVVFRLGRIIGAKGPGIVIVIPIIDRVVMVDLRIHTVDVPRQRIITRDNVEVSVDAVVYYRVQDPIKAVTTVRNYHLAVTMLAQTVLRDIIGKSELDDLLTRRDEINKELQKILDELTDPWGIKVTAVTLKEVVLPEGLVRAMARQAEAERWRRAKIIEAEGERQAAKILAEAAEIYEQHPAALRLRELSTLLEVAKEKNLIVFYPLTAGFEGVASLTALAEARKRSGESR
ncbi:slipin family protein [Hyperthermus butylicus]|uniref:Membrane protein n=1 Tax=Hyperthermus butylicus (strain DSM 5456 / JCM 9403 / PLM1-5) TaxID=415426 RepID=A2BLJ5_HYPBU|nr:slipin family protein [Hyperthermus butylicus]ABM80856.1 putative membrane protein [Hyperthermus butylicus DSM 5456]